MIFSSFRDWLTGDMGISPVELAYKAQHLIATAIVFALLLILIFVASFKKIPYKTKNYILYGIAIFQLVFEVFWRIIFLTLKHSSFPDIWPMYPCNLNGIIVPIMCLTNCKIGKKMFYSFAIIGGLLTFALPQGIFCNTVFVFPILKSVLQHTGLLFIPFMEHFMGKFKISVSDYLWTFFALCIHAFNAEVIDKLILKLPDDYMYFRSDMPFTIPGVPQFFVISPFALICIYIFQFVMDIKGSITYWKSGEWKQKYIKFASLFKKKEA